MAELVRIYVDSGCFIDAAKHAIGTAPPERHIDVWYLKQLMEAHKNKEVELFTSVITIAECSHAGAENSQQVQAVQALFDRLLTSGQYVSLIQPTLFIASDGRSLRWTHGINLSGADSIHVASGIFRKCQEFLTTDEKLGKFGPAIAKLGLSVVKPSKTNLLPAPYLQGTLLDQNIIPIRKKTGQ